jgi:D-mannonate dehydratase
LEYVVFRIDFFHLRHTKEEVILTFEELSKRKGDAIWLKPSGRYLIEEGLEGVVVVFVKHDHLDRGLAQGAPQGYSAKATTNDDYAGLVGFGNSDMHSVVLGSIERMGVNLVFIFFRKK